MHWALNQLSDVAPAWVQQQVPPGWYTRYGLRSDQARLPKDASQARDTRPPIGADGYQLLTWVWASRDLPRVRDPAGLGAAAADLAPTV